MNEEKDVHEKAIEECMVYGESIVKYNNDHYRVVYKFEIFTEKWEEDFKAWKNGLKDNKQEVEDE